MSHLAAWRILCMWNPVGWAGSYALSLLESQAFRLEGQGLCGGTRRQMVLGSVWQPSGSLWCQGIQAGTPLLWPSPAPA